MPNKSGGLWLILDLQVFIRTLHKLPFQMLSQKAFQVCPSPRLVCSDRLEGGSGMSLQAPIFRHLSQLGFRFNRGKSKLVPMQRISFLGMELDLVSQTARLPQEHAQLVNWIASTIYQAGRRSRWTLVPQEPLFAYHLDQAPEIPLQCLYLPQLGVVHPRVQHNRSDALVAP